jgi:hypothetical protein
MYLRTLQVLQDLQKAAVERPLGCHVGTSARPGRYGHADTSPAPEPAPPEETQPLAQPIGFVPPFTSATRERAAHES